MKQLKLISICLYFLIGCTKSPERHIVKELLVINKINNSIDFGVFEKALNNNEILILGEASHGDGKTFEIKSKMVKYLIENLGYNTIAFEGRSFLEMEIVNGKKNIDTLISYTKNKNWVRQWSPWGLAQQIQTLVDVTQSEKKLKYIGLEPYSHRNIENIITYLKNSVAETNINPFDPNIWGILQEIHLKIFYSKSDSISNDDFLFYLDYLEKYYDELNRMENIKKNDHTLFLLQTIENLITFVKLYQNRLSDLSEDGILNNAVKLRDKQMAKNLMWYKKRNPEAKIIAWVANFHGAIDLKNITFENGDPKRYTNFDVFGEHLSNTFGEKVFSIAFTSSQGQSKMPYNFEGIEEQTIDSSDDSLENTLDSTKTDLAFINFREIRKNKPSLADEYFGSIMLGYINQNGKWLKSFDGLFYIKKNEPAIPVQF